MICPGGKTGLYSGMLLGVFLLIFFFFGGWGGSSVGHCLPRGFLIGLVVKNPTCNAGDPGDSGSIPGAERFPGGGHGNPLQYSCWENPMDRGVWQATVHRVAKSRTRLKGLSTHTCTVCLLTSSDDLVHVEFYQSYLLPIFVGKSQGILGWVVEGVKNRYKKLKWDSQSRRNFERSP